MQYATLGRTGLRVSVAGLGCGGNSRLGLSVGKSEQEAIALVRCAIDLGVNFFDTAEAYGTEEVTCGRTSLRSASPPCRRPTLKDFGRCSGICAASGSCCRTMRVRSLSE